MITITETPFAELENAGRLLSPVFKGPIGLAGRFGFRGEIALKFQRALEHEKRPPEIKLDQVIAVSNGRSEGFDFLAGVAASLEHLKLLRDILGDRLIPGGKYFFFATNLDISSRYRIEIDGVSFWVLSLDEATVYNELLELFRVDRGDLKKLDTGGKLNALANAAAQFNDPFPAIAFDEGVRTMGPIKIRENRPV